MSTGGGFVAALGPSWEHIFLRLSPRADARAVDRPQHRRHRRARAAPTRSTRCSISPWRPTCDCQFGIPIMNTDEDDRRPAAAPSGRHHRAVGRRRARRHARRSGLHHHAAGALGARSRRAVARGRGAPASPACPPRSTACAERGELRAGWAADVVLFDPARIGLQRTELVHDLPGGAARLIQRPIGDRARARQRRAAGRARRADDGAQRPGAARRVTRATRLCLDRSVSGNV